VVLCRQRTVIGYTVAGLIVVSPFAFDFVGGSRRPDLVAFMLLAALATWTATRAAEPVVVGLVGGGLLAWSAFFSEAGPLVVGPWLVLVVGALARARRRSHWESTVAMAAAALPSMLTLGVLSVTGRGSVDTVAAMEQVAPLDVGGRGTVFPYLDDTLTVSVEKVLDRRPVLSLVVGALLLAMMWFLARRLVPCLRALVSWAIPTRALRTVWGAGLAATAVLLFGLGFDWMRWVTSIVFSAMLATGALVVLARDATVRPAGLDEWYRPVPACASLSFPSMAALAVGVYLLVLPPLPTAVRGIGQTARLLVNAPG
jgi:predicted membrane protein